MQYFSVKKIIMVAAAAYVLFVFWQLAKTWAFPDTNWKLEKESKIELLSGRAVFQKFAASRDNLSRLDFLFGKSGEKNAGKINAGLLDENCANVLRKGSFSSASMDSDKSYDFRFAKIEGSAGKIFCVRLEFEPQKDTSKNPGVFVVTNERPDNLGLTDSANQTYGSESLVMRPAYRDSRWSENIRELNDRISQYKPWFFKSAFLSVIIFSFIFLALALAVILFLI